MMPFSAILNLEKKVDGNLSRKCWNWKRRDDGEKSPLCMGHSYQERPLPPRPLSIHQNSTTGPEKGDTAYPKSRNAIEFSLLFNIDANTTMNEGNMIHGFTSLNLTASWASGFISLLIYKDKSWKLVRLFQYWINSVIQNVIQYWSLESFLSGPFCKALLGPLQHCGAGVLSLPPFLPSSKALKCLLTGE